MNLDHLLENTLGEERDDDNIDEICYEIHSAFDDCFQNGDFDTVNDFFEKVPDESGIHYTFSVLVASYPADNKLPKRLDFIERFYYQWEYEIESHALANLTGRK